MSEDTSFTESFDALVWAKAFVRYVRANPSIATDESTMLGWFANALMRGYDKARADADLRAAPAAEPGAAPKRCDVCDWPLKQRMEDGCIEGNCAYRPREGSDEWFRIKARREALAGAPGRAAPEAYEQAAKWCEERAAKIRARAAERPDAYDRQGEMLAEWIQGDADTIRFNAALRAGDAPQEGSQP